MWQTIDTATAQDAPFTVWIEPYGLPILQCATVEFDCTLDTNGNVVDPHGDQVANVTHWWAD